MEWNLKASSWDLSGIEEATTLPNIETMEESNRFGGYKTEGEFSVDLKLGQVGNSATESSSSPLPLSKDVSASVSKIASPSSSSGSFKRARAVNNTTLTVSCVVDGCNSDLSNCRDYHRRHKVCELHSKTPEVSIGGLKQRFCQQCSRYMCIHSYRLLVICSISLFLPLLDFVIESLSMVHVSFISTIVSYTPLASSLISFLYSLTKKNLNT